MKTIGIWRYIMEFSAICSIATNIAIFSFSSKHILISYPLFSPKNWGEGHSLEIGIFILEHIFILSYLGIKFLIPNTPSWVKLFFQRLRYRKKTGNLGRETRYKSLIRQTVGSCYGERVGNIPQLRLDTIREGGFRGSRTQDATTFSSKLKES